MDAFNHHISRAAEAAKANEYLYQVLDIGQAMLQSGGEVSRVEDSIRRLCAAFGAERADVFTITSSIVVTIYAHHFGAVTQTRRITGTQYDLHRLELLNHLTGTLDMAGTTDAHCDFHNFDLLKECCGGIL